MPRCYCSRRLLWAHNSAIAWLESLPPDRKKLSIAASEMDCFPVENYVIRDGMIPKQAVLRFGAMWRWPVAIFLEENVGTKPLTELERIARLIRATYESVRPCKACGAQLYFIRNRNSGAATPFTLDGFNHFENCPAASQFKLTPGKQKNFNYPD